MKTKLTLYTSALVLFAVTVFAAVVERGTIRSAALLTGSYVASDVVDMGDATLVTVEVFNDGTADAFTASLKSQWGTTTNSFIDEPVNLPGTIAGTEQPYSRTSKRFDFSTNGTGLIFTETFKRWGANRYFRIALKESTGAGTTNSTLRVVATPAR